MDALTITIIAATATAAGALCVYRRSLEARHCSEMLGLQCVAVALMRVVVVMQDW